MIKLIETMKGHFKKSYPETFSSLTDDDSKWIDGDFWKEFFISIKDEYHLLIKRTYNSQECYLIFKFKYKCFHDVFFKVSGCYSANNNKDIDWKEIKIVEPIPVGIYNWY